MFYTGSLVTYFKHIHIHKNKKWSNKNNIHYEEFATESNVSNTLEEWTEK